MRRRAIRALSWSAQRTSESRYCLAHKLKGFYVTNVSQVPAALGIIADTIGNLYPHYKKRGAPKDQRMRLIVGMSGASEATRASVLPHAENA